MATERFARLAWGVVLYTVAVVLWGAFVRATLQAVDGAGDLRFRLAGDHVEVAASDLHGLAAGSAALLQALQHDGERWRAPAMTVASAPQYGFRAVMIDCARHFQSLDVVQE